MRFFARKGKCTKPMKPHTGMSEYRGEVAPGPLLSDESLLHDAPVSVLQLPAQALSLRSEVGR
ncbi:hypothetical protein DPMN_017274 [Dreissena polymorpha]|uniref:Uncharacterized protein n=1 Tax=Dreissena polymorpha TaxID=45954 RepID=A0A9D4S764_DREPO|nr:hypothetical protein DPMN_017274 [Dreissena polymorpha]